MKDYIEMENTEFELLIAPYVKKIVDEESNQVTYEYTKRARRDTISVNGEKYVPPAHQNGAPARRISSPAGIFKNVTETADYYGLTKAEVYAKIHTSSRRKDGQWILLEKLNEQE
jgi:hypothetical protein